MAQNEMRAKPALPERVRSMEGLDFTFTAGLLLGSANFVWRRSRRIGANDRYCPLHVWQGSRKCFDLCGHRFIRGTTFDINHSPLDRNPKCGLWEWVSASNFGLKRRRNVLVVHVRVWAGALFCQPTSCSLLSSAMGLDPFVGFGGIRTCRYWAIENGIRYLEERIVEPVLQLLVSLAWECGSGECKRQERYSHVAL